MLRVTCCSGFKFQNVDWNAIAFNESTISNFIGIWD